MIKNSGLLLLLLYFSRLQCNYNYITLLFIFSLQILSYIPFCSLFKFRIIFFHINCLQMYICICIYTYITKYNLLCFTLSFCDLSFHQQLLKHSPKSLSLSAQIPSQGPEHDLCFLWSFQLTTVNAFEHQFLFRAGYKAHWVACRFNWDQQLHLKAP